MIRLINKNLMFQTALVRNKNYKKDKGKYYIYSADDFYKLVSSMSRWATEHAVIALLIKNEVVGIHVVGIGGSGRVESAPETVLASAMLTGADSVCFAHNHPNADANPSKQDYFMAVGTKRMLTCASVKLFQIILVAGDEYTDLMPQIPFFEMLVSMQSQMAEGGLVRRVVVVRRMDFIAGSGHKMYAPGSPGWLIATKQFFKGMGWMAGPIGGGSVDRVELDRVWLKDDPSERYEAGTPNIPGSIGLGVAARLLREIGMDKVLEHERALVEQCIRQVQAVPDAVVYGPLDASNKTSVVTFNIGSMPHGIVAAALNDMFAIQTRNGCFCAQPYSRQQIASACTTRGYCEPIQAGKTGMVRASFGIYSDASDIDALVAGLRVISEHKAHITPLYEETSDGTWEHKAFRSSTGFDYRKLVTKFVEEAR